MKIYKTKKIALFCVLLAFIILVSSMLYSCNKKPDIYVLIENILQNKNLNPNYPNGLYYFDVDLDIEIKKDYLRKEKILPDYGKQLDAVPDKMGFILFGTVKNSEDNISQFEITFRLPQLVGEGEDLKTIIYKKDNLLYFELNDISRAILDFLYSTGFIDVPVKTLFDSMVEYDNGSVLVFDLTDFELSMFDKYTQKIEKAFTVKSSVNYYFSVPDGYEDFDVPDYNEPKALYFSDIKTKIDKELLKLPGYRYSELFVVMEIDENKNNFMNILATHENGKTEILNKVKLDCDLVKARKNADVIYSENIIPMRYLLELLGETVEWDANNKKAYIIKEGKNIYFEGSLINSKTYISLIQIITQKDLILNSVSVDEYIEFKIIRK